MAAGVNRITKAVALASVSFLASLIVFFSGILSTFELKAYDLFSRHLNPARSSDSIIIIKVDQQSIDAMSREGITWPWPRQLYVPLVEYLSEADSVFIDILFTEASSYGQHDDMLFSEAIRKASNVYLPLFLTNKKQDMSTGDIEFIKKMALKDLPAAALSFKAALTPIENLKSSLAGYGNITIPPDKDGVYRGIPLYFACGEYTIPHFILAYLIQKGRVSINKGSLYMQDTEIPLVDQRLMLRYYREENSFTSLSAAEIIQSYLDSGRSKQPSIDRGYFRGKDVFIGLTAAGLYDLKPTSVSSISTGVLIHATTLDNIKNRNFIRPVGNLAGLGFAALICLIISYLVLRYYSVRINLSVFLITLSVVLVIPAILFSKALYMNIITPLLSLIVSFILTSAYSYSTEGKERRFVKRTFLQYMDKSIVEYILQNPHVIKPGGQRKRVAVFFADIAGFTSMAEKLSAEETAMVLHTVLNTFTDVIIHHKGVIDKYIGDCIMAFWGAPVDTGTDEMLACQAAVHCIESLVKINSKFRADGLSEINIRIGIHSGEAIVGNLGSDRLFDYTVVGDTVNIASRLESVNKLFKTKIIVSSDVMQKAGDIFLARELGLVEVKGKTVPVRIFEIVSEKGNNGSDRKHLMEMFNNAMTFFHEKRWQDALNSFSGIIKEFPDDGPSAFYVKRCEDIIKNPGLTEGQDIIRMTEK